VFISLPPKLLATPWGKESLSLVVKAAGIEVYGTTTSGLKMNGALAYN
jgi:hypothetical protein